jgi:hypothetical protein
MKFRDMLESKEKFDRVNGILVYNLPDNGKYSVWWNAAEDEVEYEIVSMKGAAKFISPLPEYGSEKLTNTEKDIKIFNKDIERIEKDHSIKLPKISKSDYKYIYS